MNTSAKKTLIIVQVMIGLLLVSAPLRSRACSVVYFIDHTNGKIYVANNEDYWYDVNAYIQMVPQSKGSYARLWYGWDHFAQGGINEAGLFFDGAVTPEDQIPDGYHQPEGNLGDELLANCRTVKEALLLLEEKKIALKNAHVMIGDSTGNAVVVEWVSGEKKLIPMTDHHLTMTNFLLSDTSKGNYPCYRYQSIEEKIKKLQEKEGTITFLEVGNVLNQSAQSPVETDNGRIAGTLYSSFINISDMEFILVSKLDNEKITRINLKTTFNEKKKRKIKLD